MSSHHAPQLAHLVDADRLAVVFALHDANGLLRRLRRVEPDVDAAIRTVRLRSGLEADLAV